jgi:hypothetical protein
MFQSIAIIACLVTTLLHGAFGCCWHHGAEAATTEPAATRPTLQCRCHGHREAASSKDAPANEDDRDCDTAHCVYINPVAEAVPATHRTTQFDQTVLLTADAESLRTAHTDHAQSLNLVRPTLSGRLARLQVWIL